MNKGGLFSSLLYSFNVRERGNAYPNPNINFLFRFPLIDFIKYELINHNPNTLGENPLLEFETKVKYGTGELGKYRHAYYRGIEIKIFDPTSANPKGRITIEGSLHKYWNNGGHNFNDFDFNGLQKVLDDLKNKFGIVPANCQIKQLEIGVNISPPFSTKKILQSCIMHKTDIFKWVFTNDEGNYVQVQHGNYYVKIYDKQKHYVKKGFNIPDEVLRFEIKYKREKLSQTIMKKGVITLKDVLDFGLSNFKYHLLQEWQNVLFYDFSILDETRYKDKYSNPNYWMNLKPENFKYHRKNLNKIVKSNPENLKKKIKNIIGKKVDSLNSNPTQIKPLNIPLIRVVGKVTSKASKNKICTVTGLNIEMQKEDSFLLSHEGLKYYYSSDRKVYNEVKRKFLTEAWNHSPHKIQIKEIAHNIRNTISNQRIKQRKLYPEHQTPLFELVEVS